MPIAPTDLRHFVYDVLIESGGAPSVAAIADHFGVDSSQAREALSSLGIGKTLLSHPDTGEVWMAGPFSADPTPYRVTGSRTTWWANCAWDMLGIAVVVGERVEIDAQCTDCGSPMRIVVDERSGPSGSGIVHFLVPAGRWYEDIGFT